MSDRSKTYQPYNSKVSVFVQVQIQKPNGTDTTLSHVIFCRNPQLTMYIPDLLMLERWRPSLIPRQILIGILATLLDNPIQDQQALH